MDFDFFHSPDGEGEGLCFGLFLCCQNIPSIINSCQLRLPALLSQERLGRNSAHPAVEKGLCSLLFIVSPTYYVLGVVLKRD